MWRTEESACIYLYQKVRSELLGTSNNSIASWLLDGYICCFTQQKQQWTGEVEEERRLSGATRTPYKVDHQPFSWLPGRIHEHPNGCIIYGVEHTARQVKPYRLGLCVVGEKRRDGGERVRKAKDAPPTIWID